MCVFVCLYVFVFWERGGGLETETKGKVSQLHFRLKIHFHGAAKNAIIMKLKKTKPFFL